jgi:putative spermidine/putrescine transport system permease protein
VLTPAGTFSTSARRGPGVGETAHVQVPVERALVYPRRADHGDCRRTARARALRPQPAAGRAGGAVHAAALRLSVPVRAVAVVHAERGRRAGELRAFFTTDNLWPTIWTTLRSRCPRRSSTSGWRCRSRSRCASGPPYQRFVTTILVVPITLGTVLIAEGMLIYFGPKGWLAQFLQFFHLYEGTIRLTHNYTGVLISLVVSGFPFAFLLILSYITGIDPGLARAAATLGADRKSQFRHIYLPLLAPGLAMCFCLSFVQAFSVFPSAVLLGSPAGPTRVISIAAYEAAFEVYDYSLASRPSR